MTLFDFPDEQGCPHCKARFRQAEKRTQYEPVVVIVCPTCSKLLWRPGLDESSPLFPFDPDLDDGI